MGWLKKHPRLYAIGGVLVVIAGGLAAVEGIWSLFSTEPLIPFIVTRVGFTSPLWIRWVVTVVFICLTVFGVMILITIFRQTKSPKSLTLSREEQPEPLELIDSFPKDNYVITTEDIKRIFLKFNKPINRETEGYIGNKFVKTNSRCQWNVGGWIQYAEDDTKLIWHIHERSLQNKDQYGPIGEDYPTFEIYIGLPPEEGRLAATDGSRLPITTIRVKIKPDILVLDAKLEVTTPSIKIGERISNDSFLLLVTVQFQPSAPIQLGKLDLVYDGKPYEPMELPTKLVERVETYEVKYKISGFRGNFLIEAGLREKNNVPENKWPQAYLHVIAGDLDFNTAKVAVPTPSARLASDK